MKNTTFLVAILFSFVSSVHAQGTAALTAENSWQDIKIGPLFSGGASVDAGTIGNGSKTGDEFAWSLGADADFPITQNFAFNLALAYDARGINFYNQATTSDVANYNFGYLVLRPEFRFSDFLIGVGVGLPISASETNNVAINPQTAVSTDSMKVLFEIRIGAAVPILQSSSGVLNLTIEGAYAFTQIVSNGPLAYYSSNVKPVVPSTSNNGPLATGEIGIQYLFDLTPH
jgi:hypothetical protein